MSDIPSKSSEINPIPINGKIYFFGNLINYFDYLGNAVKNSMNRSMNSTLTSTESTSVYVFEASLFLFLIRFTLENMTVCSGGIQQALCRRFSLSPKRYEVKLGLMTLRISSMF